MKKIVIIGPESTGKSTLAAQLAEHYNTTWCPEFAREYLLEHGRNYNFDDLLNIARGQAELERSMMSNASNGLYIIDTDMYVMKVWCEVAFERCHNWILKQIASQEYDLYLLCCTDLPWVADPLREYPDPVFRQKLFKMYKDIMINSGTRWVEVSGSYSERLQVAITAVDTILLRKSG